MWPGDLPFLKETKRVSQGLKLSISPDHHHPPTQVQFLTQTRPGLTICSNASLALVSVGEKGTSPQKWPSRDAQRQMDGRDEAAGHPIQLPWFFTSSLFLYLGPMAAFLELWPFAAPRVPPLRENILNELHCSQQHKQSFHRGHLTAPHWPSSLSPS